MMEKKIIAISGGMTRENGTLRAGVGNAYLDAVLNAGHAPMMLPMSNDEDAIEACLKVCDGLILTGGVDIHPLCYQQDVHRLCGEIDVFRDEFEYKLLKKAVALNLPILGICRGHQMLNVYFGGTLFQDITLKSKEVIQHVQLGSRGQGCQFINVTKESLLYEVLGEKGYVNSYHHQAVDRVADGFKVTAYANDGIIEAIEHTSKKMYGVQFHPEVTHYEDEKMLAIFKEFIRRI